MRGIMNKQQSRRYMMSLVAADVPKATNELDLYAALVPISPCKELCLVGFGHFVHGAEHYVENRY